jgi:hypothetical protein
MTGEQPLPSALVQGIHQLEPMPVIANVVAKNIAAGLASRAARR